VSAGAAAHVGERRLLRALAAHRAAPAAVRRLAARIEGSDLAYRLAHGAFWSFAGAALSRALALAASVVTARILGKEGFGELGVLSSTLLTFQAFSSLGLGMTATKYVAELREKDPARAGRILALSAVASAATGLLAAGAMWGFAPWLAARTLDAPQLAGALRIAAVALFFTTLGGAQTGALAGFEAFRTTTWLNVGTGLLGVPVAIAGVWLWGVTGAVWAMAVTAAVQWALTHAAVRSHARGHGIAIGIRGWSKEQRVLWTFSLPALAQGLMVSPVNWAAAAILVNQPRGYPEMGALSATNHWYAAVLFLPTALGGAVLPVLSERVGRGDAPGARSVLRTAMVLNLAVVAPIVAIGALASPRIMGMYGPGFGAAWPTLVVVLVTAGVVAVTNPVGNVLAASGRLWLGFLMNAGWAAVFLGTTLLLVPWGALGVAGARLVAYCVHAVWTLGFAAAFVRGKVADQRPSPAPIA
jgi:O-antigen/teichoic acid export membrane protein